jgi:hypothetical protein
MRGWRIFRHFTLLAGRGTLETLAGAYLGPEVREMKNVFKLEEAMAANSGEALHMESAHVI